VSAIASVRWCVRPVPEDDELLSSWLHRLAIANAICDHTVCRLMFGRLDVWNRNLDRSFPESALPILSAWTGVSVERLSMMRLGRWTGRLSERVLTRGNSAWILPAGVYHRIRRRFGLLFCPLCLAERSATALWMWRIAWSTCCLAHERMLLDRCPKCGGVYLPHRTAPSLFGKACCAHCCWDLCRSSTCGATSSALQIQLALEEALLTGGFKYGRLDLPSLHFFGGFRTMVRVLLSPKSKYLVAGILDTDVESGEVSRNVLPFEFRDLGTRRATIGAAWRLLEDWPHQFVSLMRSSRLGRWVFGSRLGDIPYWIETALDEMPACEVRGPTQEEILAASSSSGAQPGAST